MFLMCLLIIGAITGTKSVIVESNGDAVSYLAKYGYLEPGKMVENEDLIKAICKFQSFANLNETCELDEATVALMNLPRCGMPDITDNSLGTRRAKRYTLRSSWSQTDLTFRIDTFTPDMSTSDVENTIAKAFKMWSDVSSLAFTRVPRNTPADIVVNFYSGAHGDGARFDGPGGVLAHAFYPENGRAHMDEDEYWTVDSYSGTNLLQVVAHEFGHNLGLGHSRVVNTLMAPVYYGYVPKIQLHSDDIAGIQALYGAESSGATDDTPSNPVTCTGNVDAVTTTRDRSTYVFEGTHVWKFVSRTSRIATGFPKPISEVFSGLPDNIEAALFNPSTNKTYMFKGSAWWSFDSEVADSGYPRDISTDWIGVPNDIDAAMVWNDRRIYFFKGDQYYRYIYNEGVEDGYPRPVSEWNIPGNQIAAALQWIDRRTYFFTPNGDYFKLNNRRRRPRRRYPKPTAGAWQGCAGSLQMNLLELDQMELYERESNVSGLAPSLHAWVVSAMLAIVLLK